MAHQSSKQLHESVKWFALSEELIPSGGLVLAAVSGGPDSMAMLSVLHALAEDLEFRVAAAYFDHGIREGSESDGDLVEKYAARLSVPFYRGADNVPEAADASGETIEQAARRLRYEFLFDVADRTHADGIATGHTRDDHAETVLMRVIRGTGIRGLAGIPTRRGRIIRPLLSVSRADTREHCEQSGVPFCDDPSNEDDRFFRNRIRHELMPMLRHSFHEGVEDSLIRLATNAQDSINSIRAVTNPIVQQNLRQTGAGEWILNVSKVAKLDDTAIFVLFGDMVVEAMSLDMDLSRVHYQDVTKLIRDNRGSGKRLNLPGLLVKREYENLIITKRGKSASVQQHLQHRATLTLPGATESAGVRVRTEILDAAPEADGVNATANTAFFALGGIKLPLTLRSPAEGDRMKPFGMDGTKKLSDIFTDKKIPGRQRNRSLVVADATEILWVVGVATSETSRIDDGSGQVVRITVDRE